MYTSFWEKAKAKSTKLEFYEKVTNTYKMETYLKSDMNKKYKTALTQIRISAHELEIEKGRYIGKKREERICRKCNVLEDEIHFLDNCQLYSTLRHKLQKNRNIENLKISDYINIYEKEIGKYIFDAMKIRKSFHLE